MAGFITDLKRSFLGGNVLSKLIFINVGLFILIRLLSILFLLFNIQDIPFLFYLQLPASFEAYRLLDPKAPECTVLARVLARTARTAYGVHLAPAAAYRSFHDMRRLLRLTHSGAHTRTRLLRLEHIAGKSGLASSLIRPAEPLAADCANLTHRPWLSDGVEHTDSFTDLFDAAVPLAVSLQRAVLDRYYQAKPLDPRFFPTDFTGSVVKK